MVAALGLNAEHVSLVRREFSAAVPTTIHDRATVFSDFEMFNRITIAWHPQSCRRAAETSLT